MGKVWDFIKNRIKEPSTWRGLTIVAGLVGWTISPEQATAIGTVAASVLATIELFKKDANSADAK